MKKIVPCHLEALADNLRMTVLSSRADSTVKQYTYGFKRWKNWAKENVLNPVPANPVFVALYMQYPMEKASSPSSVQSAVCSIDWAHKIAGLPAVSTHPIVKVILEANARILAKPKQRKEPISIDMLKTMVSRSCNNIKDIRAIAICLTAFAGFLRFDEIKNLKCQNVIFHEDYVELKLESSKTDQFRDGAKVLISKTGSATCPVQALEKYVLLGKSILQKICHFSEH